MEGVAALQFWGFVVETCSDSSAKGNLTRPSGKRHSLSHSKDDISMVDHVSSSIPESSFRARRCIFEDSDAVIRKIIKGRSRNLRHESRTHRVDLDWLCERTNLDSAISIRHVRTTEQVADILTNNPCTTVQWQSLIRLFIHPSSNLKC